MEKHCCHSPLSLDEVKDLLSSRGISRTKAKIQILLKLSKSSKPLSANELYSHFSKTYDLSTIFRTVAQFKEKDLIKEVDLGEGFYRFEFHSPEHGHKMDHHHHHVRCRNCGDIKQIERCDLSAFEKAIAKLGFKDMEHRLDFSGLCSKCS